MDKCAMKVGTDGVLLGAYVNPHHSKTILDIGTGCGLIALMVAQKTNAQIDAIDIDEQAIIQAGENFKKSQWPQRLYATHTSLQEFIKNANRKYDFIVSNPPFFNHASKPATEGRIQSRHTDLLSFDDLIQCVKQLLNPHGKFALILPHKEGLQFIDLAQRNGLFCNDLLHIHTKIDKPEKRLIMQFGFKFETINDQQLIIQNQDNSFSKEYIDLTKDYYLHIDE